jgi:hypothetical protein
MYCDYSNGLSGITYCMSLLALSVGLVLSEGIHSLVSLRESTHGLYGAGLGCFPLFAFLSQTTVIVRNRIFERRITCRLCIESSTNI